MTIIASMRGAAALLSIALLFLTPLAGATASRGNAGCKMSCCMASAHACAMHPAATSCRNCSTATEQHAPAAAKVVMTTPALPSTLPFSGDVAAAPACLPESTPTQPPTPPPQTAKP